MRVIVIWLLFSVPLAITSVRYVVQVTRQSGNVPSQALVSANGSSDATESHSDVLPQLDLEQLEVLGELPVFYRPNSNDKPPVAPASSRHPMKPITDAAVTALRIGRGIRELKRINLDESDLADSLDQIEMFCAGPSSANPTNSDLMTLHQVDGIRAVISRLEQEAKKLQTSIADEDNRKRARDAYQIAHREFRSSEFDRCLRSLKSIPDSRLTDEDKELQRQAEFWSQWSKLGTPGRFTIGATSSSIRNQLNLFERVLDTAPVPTETDEQEYEKWVRTTQAALDTRLKVKQLEERTISNPSIFLKEAEKIVATNPDVHRQLQATFRELIERRIVEKRIVERRATSTQVKEAIVKKDGSLLRGFFQLSVTGNYYKFWAEELGKGGKYREVYVDKLQQKPLIPFPNRAASEFNSVRENAMKDLGNRELWENLQNVCQRLDDELKQYKDQAGAANVKLDFRNDGRYCTEIIENWKLVEALMQQ